MDKVALITGGTRGIGRAIAEAFATDHHVAVTWRSTPPQGLPDGVLAVEADFTESGTATPVVDAAIETFGRLDVIVNNAGSFAASEPEGSDPGALMAMMQVNLFAAQALLEAALPHLQPGAAIVNISSTNADLPPKGGALYGASKAGLNLWTRGMAKELGPRKIRVNAVAPGAVEVPDKPRPEDLVALFADMTALGRLATPEDIAHAVRFLASDTAGCITGQVLGVNGGYRL